MPKQPFFTILIKPASGACNLRCRYCFYADEMKLRREGGRGMMSPDTLEILVRKTLEQTSRSATFAFQGGEPTLAGLDFFRRLIEIEKKYRRRGVEVQNTLQTNGIILDREWAEFLRDNRFLVGLSLDGCRELHDENRVFPDGAGTFERVMDAARLLQEYGVDFNILSVVTDRSAKAIRRSYRFFAEQGFAYQQYIPCIDPIETADSMGSTGVAGNSCVMDATMNPAHTGGPKEAMSPAHSLSPESYGRFLKDLFDFWYADQTSGRPVYNRTFQNWVNMLAGWPPESCSMSGVCSQQWVAEADGSIYPCDFYALDEWRLGNIRTDSFDAMEEMRQKLGFVSLSENVPEECRRCGWYPLCRNGCRRDRLPLPDGRTPGLNRYCESFRDFFSYAYPRLEAMALI